MDWQPHMMYQQELMRLMMEMERLQQEEQMLEQREARLIMEMRRITEAIMRTEQGMAGQSMMPGYGNPASRARVR